MVREKVQLQGVVERECERANSATAKLELVGAVLRGEHDPDAAFLRDVSAAMGLPVDDPETVLRHADLYAKLRQKAAAIRKAHARMKATSDCGDLLELVSKL